ERYRTRRDAPSRSPASSAPCATYGGSWQILEQKLIVLGRIEVAENLGGAPLELVRLVCVSANVGVQSLFGRHGAYGGVVRPAEPGRMAALALMCGNDDRLRAGEREYGLHHLGPHRRVIRGQ